MILRRFKIFALLLVCVFGAVAQSSPNIPEHFELSEYPSIAEEIVTYLENHGYPFATVTLEAAQPEQGDMTPRIRIDSNLFVTFDSIVLKGDVKLALAFLYPYLGLKKGMPYSEKVMRAVPAKLNELPYATVIRDAGVSFVKDKAYLYLYLDKRATNQFDGYLGIEPVNETTGKVSVYGELNLALQNIFHLGESIALQWQSSERYSQSLDITAKFPYLFRTRFGLNGTFQLDKVDTSYLTTDFHLGVLYSFLNNSYIEPYIHIKGSSILNPELISFDSDTGFIDYRKTLYGLQVHYRRLDYLFNPRQGIDFEADLSTGRRVIRTNTHVDAQLYESLEMTKTTFSLSGILRGYLPIGKRFVLAPKLEAGSLLSGLHYYNELFKISGVEKLRGFNENDIRATTYLLYSVELRFIFQQRSYIHLFFDGGAYEQQLTNAYTRDFPFGFGVGLNLAVRSGIFYIEYALGRQMKNPISFKSGLIHFGLKVDF